MKYHTYDILFIFFYVDFRVFFFPDYKKPIFFVFCADNVVHSFKFLWVFHSFLCLHFESPFNKIKLTIKCSYFLWYICYKLFRFILNHIKYHTNDKTYTCTKLKEWTVEIPLSQINMLTFSVNPKSVLFKATWQYRQEVCLLPKSKCKYAFRNWLHKYN